MLALVKHIDKANQVRNNQIVNWAIFSINELRNAVIPKKFPEDENSNKVIDIDEEMLNFNKQQKAR